MDKEYLLNGNMFTYRGHFQTLMDAGTLIYDKENLLDIKGEVFCKVPMVLVDGLLIFKKGYGKIWVKFSECTKK